MEPLDIKPCRKCGSTDRGPSRASSRLGDCKSCARTSAKKWDLLNAEKKKARNAAWHRKNREKVISRVAKYHKEYPELTRIYGQNYRAKKKKNGGELSRNLPQILMKLQNGKCACCKEKLVKYDMDHIIPVSKGGENIDKNIQLLCQSCNRAKGARDAIEFMRSRGYLL